MISAYLIPILTVILGIVMLAIAEKVFIILVIVLGAFLILSGSTSLFQLMKLSTDKNYRINLLVRSALSILLGALCIILSVNGTLDKAVSIMLVILGIYAVLAAGSEVVTVIKLKEEGIPVRKYITEIAGTVIAAVILFLLASPYGENIVKFCGIVVILIGAILAIAAWRNVSADKENEKAYGEGTVIAEVKQIED